MTCTARAELLCSLRVRCSKDAAEQLYGYPRKERRERESVGWKSATAVPVLDKGRELKLKA